MAVPFGFSIGDFLAAIDFATKVYKSLHPVFGATTEYQEATARLKHVKNLATAYNKYSSRHQPGQDSSVDQQLHVCATIVKVYQEKLERFDKALGAQAPVGRKHGMGRKVQWTLSDDIGELEKKLIDHLSLIHQTIETMEW